MPDMTPAEVATHLRVSAPTVRRMAASYELVMGLLPRDQRGARRWPMEAVRQVQAAHQALATGRVASLERALELVRDGAELPERVTLSATPDPLVELVAEIRALRLVVEAQSAELASLRELVQRRELPAPTPAHPPADPPSGEVQEAVQDAVRAALDPERLRVALHATAPAERPKRGMLARLFGLQPSW